MVLLVIAPWRPGGILAAQQTPKEGTVMQLEPCPGSPNCVSSQSQDPRQRVNPIRYEGAREAARERLLAVLRSMDRARIVQAAEESIQVEFRSLLFRFVDDVTFLFPEGEGTIQVRSASRTGYYDFGVNRRRVERIREIFGGARLQ